MATKRKKISESEKKRRQVQSTIAKFGHVIRKDLLAKAAAEMYKTSLEDSSSKHVDKKGAAKAY